MAPGAEPVADRPGAEALLGDLSRLMSALTEALDAETDLVGAGRLRDGLAGEARKAELGQAYIRHLQAAKQNVVALTRHAPERLREFRAAQAVFERVLERNQTVIATAKSVSEGIMKSLAEELDRQRRPVLYGSRPAATSSGPLVFSRRY